MTKRPKGARPPHNAAKPKTYRSIGELARAIGAEPRRATVRGEEVVMSQVERLFRIIVDNAIAGSASDLRLLIKAMIDHPQIAGSSKERWVLLLAGDDAKL